MKLKIGTIVLLALGVAGGAGAAQNPAAIVQVDASKSRHAIDPRIYGIAYADAGALSDLNAPLNRNGGDPTSRYNWAQNADNRASDWYFESIGDNSPVPGERGDTFITASKTGGARAMLTIPMTDWIAKLGANRSTLASFSIAKYGAQADNDKNGLVDAGNGISKMTGQPIVGNDPNDANAPNSAAVQHDWVQHLVAQWGTAANGGLQYYFLDNEPSAWYNVHRDVQPTGLKMDDYLQKAIDYATMIKNLDPGAIVLGPEEWGWDGFLYSGYDQQYGSQHGFASFPDRAAHGNMDYIPWILDQLHQHDQKTGQRLLDVLTVHYYPQSGEFDLTGMGDDLSEKTQLLRNRSTRSLWDPDYTDVSWINSKVNLIPRLKQWVTTYYPGTQIGLTEYNWGAEGHINGATAQADVLGILGREGVDLANRWTTPAANTPAYNAIKMYRNYDGKRSVFGDTSVMATGPNPDDVAVFAAQRAADGALTVMVVNKDLSGTTPVTLNLAGFAPGDHAEVWQLSAKNSVDHLADVPVNAGSLSTSVPAPSITLFVIPGQAKAPDTVINFDDQVDGTAIISQYHKLGVDLDRTANLGPLDASVAPATVTATADAHSAPNALWLEQSGGGEFRSWFLGGTFTNPHHSHVKVWIRSLVAGTVTLRVYRAPMPGENPLAVPMNDPKLLDGETVQIAAGSKINTVLEASSNQADIANFTISTDFNSGAAIDDLTFDTLPEGGGMGMPAPAAFTSTTIAMPSPVAPGGDVIVSTTITDTGGPFMDGIADLEIYDAAGNKVAQKFFEHQSFTAGQAQSYTYDWLVPAAPGTYTVEVGVFTTGWTGNPYWNNAAAAITVQNPPVGGGGGGALMPGDVNGDGRVTVADAVVTLQAAIGNLVLTPAQKAAADLAPGGDPNGPITVADALLVLLRAVGLGG